MEVVLAGLAWDQTEAGGQGVSGGSGDSEIGGNAVMIKRWLIRSILLLLLASCVVGWAWSLTHWGALSYRHNGLQISFNTSSGVTVLQVVRFKPPCPDAWGGMAASVGFRGFWPISNRGPRANPGYHIPGGIGWNHHTLASGGILETYELYIPYWLLMLMFLMMLFVAWRKTRPKPAGFPVEVARKGEGV
jgi:hypothetical protein